MNDVTSAQSASWQQYALPFTRKSVGNCLQKITSNLAHPSTQGKVAIVACVLFSLIPVVEASLCREDCYSSFNSCNDLMSNLLGFALFGPVSFLSGNSCGDKLRGCLRYCDLTKIS